MKRTILFLFLINLACRAEQYCSSTIKVIAPNESPITISRAELTSSSEHTTLLLRIRNVSPKTITRIQATIQQPAPASTLGFEMSLGAKASKSSASGRTRQHLKSLKPQHEADVLLYSPTLSISCDHPLAISMLDVQFAGKSPFQVIGPDWRTEPRLLSFSREDLSVPDELRGKDLRVDSKVTANGQLVTLGSVPNSWISEFANRFHFAPATLNGKPADYELTILVQIDVNESRRLQKTREEIATSSRPLRVIRLLKSGRTWIASVSW
jgi:hypothetical protein